MIKKSSRLLSKRIKTNFYYHSKNNTTTETYEHKIMQTQAPISAPVFAQTCVHLGLNNSGDPCSCSSVLIYVSAIALSLK